MSSVSLTILSQVASVVCNARMISTSCIIGTGLKKCMPMTRPGTFEVEAMRVTEIDEVLVARTASARQTRSRFPDTSFLRSKLEHGLDDDVAIGEILDPGRGRDALKRRIARLGLELVARDEPFEALLDRTHAAAERRFADVLQPHRIAGRREHLRDPGPHRARPHDPDRLHALDHCNAPLSTSFGVYRSAVRNQC